MLVHDVLHDDVEEAEGSDERGGHREHHHHREDHELTGVMFPKPELVADSSVDSGTLSWSPRAANSYHEPGKNLCKTTKLHYASSYKRKSGTLRSSRLVPMKADVMT